jgi:hypothetical protein
VQGFNQGRIVQSLLTPEEVAGLLQLSLRTIYAEANGFMGGSAGTRIIIPGKAKPSALCAGF